MTEAMQRRTVLAGSGMVLASLAVAACSTSDGSADASASTSTAPEPSTSSDSSGGGQVLAATSAVAIGGGVVVSSPPIVITQPSAGQFNGFTAICPHQGCLVSRVEDNEIICPCHGSRFSASDGSVINGPAEVGLQTADVAVEGSNVVLA
ncbi:MAG: Rieske (2Fe-2S) protein [Actinomycetota bacterium]|nr:Rieske (2Fe-2S) protein [Actinomycetota bacterium]MDP2288630.1 Rieske (2Fe-2S) protein [Actinomycetota bacterium]